jgi:hypothetical protein
MVGGRRATNWKTAHYPVQDIEVIEGGEAAPNYKLLCSGPMWTPHELDQVVSKLDRSRLAEKCELKHPNDGVSRSFSGPRQYGCARERRRLCATARRSCRDPVGRHRGPSAQQLEVHPLPVVGAEFFFANRCRRRRRTLIIVGVA